MNKTRIAVVGAGTIGLAHIAVLRQSPTCSLAAIVDPMTSAKNHADAAGVAFHSSLAELFGADKPDAVILATPNHLHVAQAIECIAASVAVLLEKPIAPTVTEGEKLVRVVEETGARLLIGHHRAHSPIMAKACQVIQGGALGRIVAVMGSATFYKPDSYFSDSPWRSQIGGGPILLNLIHEIHNLRLLCGEIAAVQAIASNAVRGFAVEDTVAINLRFASGALGTFMLSDTAASAKSWEQTSQENKAYWSDDDEDCYVISGTNGSLAVPTMRLKTYPRPQDRSWWKPFETGVVGMLRDDPLKIQIEHFGAVARGETPPLVSARDGLTNLRVTEAIAAAALSGTTVDVLNCAESFRKLLRDPS
jgi:predicted dehydrogenase